MGIVSPRRGKSASIPSVHIEQDPGRRPRRGEPPRPTSAPRQRPSPTCSTPSHRAELRDRRAAGVPYYSLENVEGRAAWHSQLEGPRNPPHGPPRSWSKPSAGRCHVAHQHRHGAPDREARGSALTRGRSCQRWPTSAWPRPRPAEHRPNRKPGHAGPPLLAPEQAGGASSRPIGPACRCLCPGHILYELVVGPAALPRRPLPLTPRCSAGLRGARGAVPPESRVPCDLETICLRCLQKDPAEALRHGRGPGGRPGPFPEERAESRPRPVGPMEKFVAGAAATRWSPA